MHIPVFKKEVLQFLNIKKGGKYIDATYGFGGHAKEIAKKAKVLSIEKDPELAKGVVNGSFADIFQIAKEHNFLRADGILFDFGFSSWHIEKSGRGFSFQRNEVLDMRFNQNQELTAASIVNSWNEKDIERIIRELGQERFAKRIAENIVKKRPFQTTFQLNEAIRQAVPFRTKIHPSTRTFQALRMAVNNELEEIEQGLKGALEVLKKGGRLVAISFHSLEDKKVKRFFLENNLKILTKKPITASLLETKENPRARSAKLRAAEKI